MMDVLNVWAFKMCIFSVYEWGKIVPLQYHSCFKKNLSFRDKKRKSLSQQPFFLPRSTTVTPSCPVATLLLFSYAHMQTGGILNTTSGHLQLSWDGRCNQYSDNGKGFLCKWKYRGQYAHGWKDTNTILKQAIIKGFIVKWQTKK